MQCNANLCTEGLYECVGVSIHIRTIHVRSITHWELLIGRLVKSSPLLILEVQNNIVRHHTTLALSLFQSLSRSFSKNCQLLAPHNFLVDREISRTVIKYSFQQVSPGNFICFPLICNVIEHYCSTLKVSTVFFCMSKFSLNWWSLTYM